MRGLCAVSACARRSKWRWTAGPGHAFLMTLLPEPPYNLIAQHGPNADSLTPHSRLAEEVWIAGHLAYLRDADLIVERKKKYQGHKPKAEVKAKYPLKA